MAKKEEKNMEASSDTQGDGSTRKQAGMPVKIKYEAKSALYANQFILNQSGEELFIDFSSGPIPDPGTGQTLVPIHTRIAISYPGTKRLCELLNKAVENHIAQAGKAKAQG